MLHYVAGDQSGKIGYLAGAVSGQAGSTRTRTEAIKATGVLIRRGHGRRHN